MNTYLLSKTVPVLLLAVVPSLLYISCSNPSQVVAQPGMVLDDGSEGKQADRELDAYIDFSQSLNDGDLLSTVRNFLNNLPKIVETWNVDRLRVYEFREDGWGSDEKLKIDLPKLTLPRPQRIDAGELGILPHIRQALEDHFDAQVAREEAKVRQKYREEMKKALGVIEESMLLPPPNSPEPPCTDLNGVLHRVSETSGARPRLVVVITDGVENCTSSLHPVSKPESDLALVIILVPEKPEGTGQTHKRIKKGHEHFETRSAQLSEAAPWAIVVPHFREDLSEAFKEAQKMYASYAKAITS